MTYGADRKAALDTMAQALDNYVIRGVTNNIPLLRDIITEKNFTNGDISTKYLYQTYPDGFKGKSLTQKEMTNLIGLGATVYAKDILRSREFLNSKRYSNHITSKC